MENTFLWHVAKDMLNKYGTNQANIAVVFPNKRAALFINQALTALAGKPVWCPKYLTISELFRNHSNLTIADPIKAICDLHKSFVSVTGKEETLDQFYGWGQLLLSDFDDIDKNNADAKKVFANLRDLREYDDLSYLSEQQKEIIKRFFGNLNDDKSLLQKRFLQLWDRLYQVYIDYNGRLKREGLAYEGMLYRDVISRENVTFEYEHYVFVGFNVLHEVERLLFKRLKSEGKATFYWDYDHYYTDINYEGQGHEAGIYIRRHLLEFPNELDNGDNNLYCQMNELKDMTFISAATENIQARYVSTWLRSLKRDPESKKVDTAIVLCNEGLLQTVIHSIPDDIGSINVTAGYPLQQTPIASLVTLLVNLWMNGFSKRHQAFRLHELNNLFRHPYAVFISPEIPELHRNLNENRIYYIKADELRKDESLSYLFDSIFEEDHETQKPHLTEWLKTIVKTVAQHGEDNNDAMFQESLYRMYTLLNRLSDLINSGDLIVENTTLQRLLRQLTAATTIPFHGEPARGVQIMGVLETRNLDFEHVLILSCNEGNMPKGVDDASFIPHALRAAYGLTTIDNKVAIYSYYFHRLLQRAKDVTILYCNATEGSHTGEMSRFMLQMLVEWRHSIKRETLQAGQTPVWNHVKAIEKHGVVTDRIRHLNVLSPTAINTYRTCQIQFFYKYVAGLREPDQTDEAQVDNRIFGNIFHRAAQLMYEQLLPEVIETLEPVDLLLKEPAKLATVLDQAISEELFNLPKGTVRHPELNGLQIINREVISTYLLQLLRNDRKLIPFRVIGHEVDVAYDVTIGDRKIKIAGRIDRIDQPNTGTQYSRLRVVDYKTGSRLAKDIKSMDDVFDSAKIQTYHNDYIMQALLYSIIVGKRQGGKVSPALLFVQRAGKDDYSPVLTYNGEPIDDVHTLENDFMEHLRQLLEELYDSRQPFVPTENKAHCSYCPYRAMCGK